jgi:5'-3' exonuclease
MPHFPAINIRTGGMDKMLNAYRETIGKTDKVLTDGKKIYWNNVRKMVQILDNQEEQFLKDECKLRDKKEKFVYPTDTPENIFKKFEAIPTYEREVEKYINPYKDYWQTRYYRALCNIHNDKNGIQVKNLCLNYLEGLEWTLKYYTSGCPNWRWYYKYNYPPLLTDLLKYIPVFDTTFIDNLKPNPVSPMVQLCYVLPRSGLSLLPNSIELKLLKDHEEWYKTDCEFIWSFCRYFWESHVKMNEIDLEELELFVNKQLSI